MADLSEIIITIAIILLFTFGPMGAWYMIGKHFENKHYKSIREREAKLINMSLIPSDIQTSERKVEALAMVTGSVVIASDPFKRYIASLVGLVGGRVAVFEPMLDRARREAVLRMKERAQKLKADEIINFRLETMAMSSSKKGMPTGIVEVLACGTALKYEKRSDEICSKNN